MRTLLESLRAFLAPFQSSRLRKRRSPHGFAFTESLEDRNLLSAVMASTSVAGVAEDTDASNHAHEKAPRNSRKGPSTYPDMTGHWTVVTHFPELDIQGSMDLTQKGRKVTGTFQNAGQPPGKLVAKFTKAKANETSKLKGKTKNLSIESNEFVNFVADVIGSVIEGAFKTGDDDFLFEGSKSP